MPEFYRKLLILTAICGALLLGFDLSGLTNIGSIGWIALLFFVLLTIVLTNYSLKAGKISDSRFITSIMGATGIRMLFCIIFIIFYWVVAGKRDQYFIFYFFILYLFFTMFEITFLVHKLRADKKDGLKS